MSPTQQPPISVSQVLRTLDRYRLRWIAPAVLITLAALGYAIFKPAVWEASQGLIMRNEALTSLEAPGKFRHDDEMKTTQETLLEIASSTGVLRGALAAVGPAANAKNTADFPNDDDIAGLRSAMKLSPPKGSEFGKTEVFYLHVKDGSRQRATRLVVAICDQLQLAPGELRDAKAASVLEELVTAEKLAREDLDTTTAKLADLELKVPSDLAELRMLHQSPSGDSELQRALTEAQNERRKCLSAQGRRTNSSACSKPLSRMPTSFWPRPTRCSIRSPACDDSKMV